MHGLLAGALGYALGFASCVGIIVFLVRASYGNFARRYS
jgi:hypothetical protein